MAALILLLGLVMASFVGTMAYRVPRGISMLRPCSFCPGCGRRLTPLELVPVAGYLVTRGRCPACGYRVPVRYPAAEALTAPVYVLLFLRYGLTPDFLVLLYLVTLLLYLSLVDLDQGGVSPAEAGAVYLGGAAVVLLKALVLPWGDPLPNLYAFLGTGALLGLGYLAVYLLRRKPGLGGGDLLVLPGVALYLQPTQAVRMLLASCALGIAAWLLLAALDRRRAADPLPLLPFVAGGVCVEILLFSGYVF
jgi:leader peptidase (prepilin peptidase)/N-methyltransferase